ncbi:MAG: hypothetical protein NT154_00480 [Verrucomicrobia bacterium]|nr:hypothetical protein [Verrucomicrobiota bacterium]
MPGQAIPAPGNSCVVEVHANDNFVWEYVTNTDTKVSVATLGSGW